MPTPDQIHDTADRLARYFTARVFHADYDDLYNEAWLALLIAAPNYRPERGEWGPWAARVASRHLRAHLYASGAPVTGSRSRPATVSASRSVSADVLAEVLAFDSPTTDARLEAAQAARAVREAVTDATARMDAPRRRASRAVLLDGLRPREAAASEGLDPRVVSWAVRRARADVKARHAAALRAYL